MQDSRLKKPSRPPPPPPRPPAPRSASSHRFYNDKNYIRISECSTGIPEKLLKPSKPRASTSFSSNSSSSSPVYSNHHQKSRSLEAYTYIHHLPQYSHNTIAAPRSSFTEYKQVDFLRTEALNKCKFERNKEDC